MNLTNCKKNLTKGEQIPRVKSFTDLEKIYFMFYNTWRSLQNWQKNVTNLTSLTKSQQIHEFKSYKPWLTKLIKYFVDYKTWRTFGLNERNKLNETGTNSRSQIFHKTWWSLQDWLCGLGNVTNLTNLWNLTKNQQIHEFKSYKPRSCFTKLDDVLQTFFLRYHNIKWLHYFSFHFDNPHRPERVKHASPMSKAISRRSTTVRVTNNI